MGQCKVDEGTRNHHKRTPVDQLLSLSAIVGLYLRKICDLIALMSSSNFRPSAL